jgi:hypothetical protein
MSPGPVKPAAVGAVLAGWMIIYGRRARRTGERPVLP